MVFIQIEEECCWSDATNVGSAVFVAVVVVIVLVVGFTLRENKYVERENACLRREERTMSVWWRNWVCVYVNVRGKRENEREREREREGEGERVCGKQDRERGVRVKRQDLDYQKRNVLSWKNEKWKWEREGDKNRKWEMNAKLRKQKEKDKLSIISIRERERDKQTLRNKKKV